MTKQELINKINKRIEELKENVEHSCIIKNYHDVDYFKGSLNECYSIKYLLESYFKSNNEIHVHYSNFNQYKIDCKLKNNEGFYVTDYDEREDYIIVTYEWRD